RPPGTSPEWEEPVRRGAPSSLGWLKASPTTLRGADGAGGGSTCPCAIGRLGIVEDDASGRNEPGSPPGVPRVSEGRAGRSRGPTSPGPACRGAIRMGGTADDCGVDVGGAGGTAGGRPSAGVG